MSVIANAATPANVSRAAEMRAAEVTAQGGRLVRRLLVGVGARAVLEGDAELIATGALSPLEGFIGRRDHDSIMTNMRLSPESGGHVFPVPIMLAVTPDVAARLHTELPAKQRDARAVFDIAAPHVQA